MKITTSEIVTIDLNLVDIREAILMFLRSKGIAEVIKEDITFHVSTDEKTEVPEMYGCQLRIIKNNKTEGNGIDKQ